jgi:hypothetical protein
MPVVLVVGPAVALIGVIAVFFVMRHKSVDKRSMYSARRSQIEHKVRAARQRTLTPHGRAEKPAEPPPAPAAPMATSIYAPTPPGPQVTYEPSAYEPPPAAPPAEAEPAREAGPSPWDVGQAADPYAVPPPPPSTPEPTFAPGPVQEPASEPAPSEPVWTPAPAPSRTADYAEPAPASTSADSASASWSVVSENKASAESGTPDSQPKGKGTGSSWQLASGMAPGLDTDEVVKTRSPLIGIAQYAVMVIGLLLVLIGVVVTLANSHVS